MEKRMIRGEERTIIWEVVVKFERGAEDGVKSRIKRFGTREEAIEFVKGQLEGETYRSVFLFRTILK